MITRETLEHLSTGTFYSIKEYLPVDQKSLLLDILYFLSIKTETPQVCIESDIRSIKVLFEYCNQMNIEPENYVSCAYDYIGKFVGKGHKIHVSYLLNEKVIEFCSKHVKSCSNDALIFNQVRTNILMIEKQIRNYSKEQNISYTDSLLFHYRTGKVSEIFLLYKVYMGAEPFADIKLSDTLEKMFILVKPIFIQMTSRYGLYPNNKIQEWNNSKIEAFNFCPIYFRDVYLNEEIPHNYLGNESTRIGTAVHKIFEDVIYKYIKAKVKDFETIYKRHLTCKSFLEVEHLITEHRKGLDDFFLGPNSIIKKYFKPDTQIFIEETMYYTDPATGLKFYGTADLILINGDEAILLDYKTSKIEEQKWIDKNNEKYHKQLSLYAKFIKERFNVSSVKAIIIYTRGLIHEFPSINEFIVEERTTDIQKIKNTMKMNSFRSNSSSCFLCRHPNCKDRTRESIWDSNGNKKVK